MEKIEDSRAFAANLNEIRSYHRTLRPGDVTLTGLIAEGGQGMRTANNARFLAYLEGSPQARELEGKAARWTASWLADQHVAPEFRQFLREAGGNPDYPIRDRAAWETAVHRLRERFTPQQHGLGRTALPVSFLMTLLQRMRISNWLRSAKDRIAQALAGARRSTAVLG